MSVIEVKQIADRDARNMGMDTAGKKSGIGEFTVLPYSTRSYLPSKNLDGSYITGFDENNKEDAAMLRNFERNLKLDLSPASEFWSTLRINLSMPSGNMRWNLANPFDMLKYKAALANKLVAPSLDELKENPKYKGLIYYVKDEETENAAREKKELLLDEITHGMFSIRNSKERLLYICSALGLYVTSGMRLESLYTTLSTYRSSIASLDKLEKLKDIITRDPNKLQAEYYVKEAFSKNIIYFNKEGDTYVNTLNNKPLGKIKEEVVKYFLDKKNEDSLAELINHFKIKSV